MTDPEYLTTDQVAQYLQVSSKWVRTEAKKGTSGLPGHRIGGIWRFVRREIDAWVLSR